MPVNLIVDLDGDRFDEAAAARALAASAAAGYRLVESAVADDRLAAWIDWQFAPSWWSSEARSGGVWCAYDASGEIAGFATFDARGFPFPWLRSYRARPEVGIFGPFGIAPAHRKTGLGAALLVLALASLRVRRYLQALIPAVGPPRLQAMYVSRTGARVADEYRYDAPRRFRATILASGGGTNAQHVFDRTAAGALPLEIGLVVTNAVEAPVIARAARAGIQTRTVVWERATQTRELYDARVIAAVADSEPELILLLGWMHLLPPEFIDRFPHTLNLHPAFLPLDPRADEVTLPDGTTQPAFRGAHAVRDALAANARWTGASVHQVTALTDRGAIVVRTPLPLDPAVTLVEAAATLRPVEHAAVAAAVRRWCFERQT